MYKYLNSDSNYNLKDMKIKKINIFIGANNSGKSRTVRKLLKECFDIYNLTYEELEKSLERLTELSKKILYNSQRNDGFYSMRGLVFEKELNENIRKIKSKIDDIKELNSNEKFKLIVKDTQSYSIRKYEEEKQLKDLKEMVVQLEKIEKKLWEKKLYIPTLRGLRTLVKNKDIYFERTKQDYFSENENVKIFTGLELYSKLQDMLLGELEEREKVSKFETFLSENFFENQKISLIPKLKDDVVHIKIGTEDERPIYSLGDGIQSIIILTFPLFENEGKKILIGLEEPELYLHPGMQRKLVEVLVDKENKYGFQDFIYLITTHSNHFLDLTFEYDEEIIIYESRKEGKKLKLTNRNDKNILELMENLGVRNSSVFLANSTIWVEGITDRLYLKKYLEIYQNEMLSKDENFKIYEEDKHYSFIEYSGGNITHWDFLDEEEGMASSQISNKIFLLADTDGYRNKINKDGTPSEKSKRIEALENSNKIEAYLLECREIENLLTPRIIKEVIKEDGIEIQDFVQVDYRGVGLGEYIDDTLLKDKDVKKKYKAKSGTVKDKVNFCKKSCLKMTSYDDLSEETITLCQKIYEFIKKSNL